MLTSEDVTSRLLDRWQHGDFELVACPRLVHEVRKALLSPRLAKRYEISDFDANAFAGKLTEEGLMREDPEDPPRVVPNDPKDDYLVALAMETGILVTRDRHFDKVAEVGVRVMNARDALDLLDS